MDSIVAPSLSTTPVDFKKIIDQSVYPEPELNDEQRQAFINRYSFSALVLQFVYYFAMGDQPFAWLSLICSVSIVLTPLLVIFPFFARRRAYQKRKWLGFAEFYHAQKKWDRDALYLLIATIILGVVALWLIGPMILQSIQNLTGQSGSINLSGQLQDSIQQYRDILNLP